MRFFSPLLILAALLAAACGGAAVFPEVFSQERADGKIPVSIELIRKQTQKEIDGMPEKQATAERWRDIEADYNDCRVSSARKTKAEADKVFADCMSRKGYVYMLRLDAEQLHDEIAAAEPAKYAAEKKAEEEARIAAEKRRKEEAAAAERRRKAKRLAAEKKAEEKRVAAKEKAAQEENDSGLRRAASNGSVYELNFWLNRGANPNAARDDGATALILAAQEGHTEITKILLSAGANPNTAIYDGVTALILAAGEGHTETAKILLSAGANPNAAIDDGATVLYIAAKYGHSEVIKVLLSAGANPNAETNDEQTALMAAADNGHSEIVKLLLSANANPNKVNKVGGTALMVAALEGHPQVAKMLLDAGANPNARGTDGWTALLLAASEEKPAVAKVLLECGANPHIKNNHGKSAWDWATRHLLILPVFVQYQAKIARGWLPSSCKNQRIITAAASPTTTNNAAQIFENVWRHVVVIRQGENQGSGVIVRPNVVATNCHVVDNSGDIVIYKHDNRRASTDTLFNATIRKHDDARDFCLLNVPNLGGNSAKVRRYGMLEIGEDVYAVGSPKGLDLSLSSGLISQLRQGGGKRFIQTDAAISPGSSGGGLFDSDGNLVGILTSKLVDEEVEGIGFAIPADLAIEI